ncbi:hypothetical protein LTR12_017184 [Friedmanniomyces endolithicus]|nr:hypothetical protein LTR74_016223 [Friedmanniomyces endolithicus]KAK1808456.1 hypothetical protein LTR12_017184 [Friedmanniomyces endolithicus]
MAGIEGWRWQHEFHQRLREMHMSLNPMMREILNFSARPLSTDHDRQPRPRLTYSSYFADTQTQGTPFAPSVEKAYYRKCIELKRRLNDVEAANDEAKIKRVRLDRAIMKMRLERAFLLEQLSKRMDVNVDGSEGSGDEGPAVEPPPERPHRDKRRRPERPLAPHHHPSTSHSHQQQPQLQPSPSNAMQAYPLASLQRLTPNAVPKFMVPGPSGEMVAANAVSPEGHLLWLPPVQLAAIPPQHSVPLVPVPSTPGYGPPQHGSPHCAPVGVPGATAAHAQPNGRHGYDGAADEREPLPHVQANANRSERATGEALSAGPAMREESNGEGRIVADNSGAALETPDEREEMRAMGGGGFNAINH